MLQQNGHLPHAHGLSCRGAAERWPGRRRHAVRLAPLWPVPALGWGSGQPNTAASCACVAMTQSLRSPSDYQL